MSLDKVGEVREIEGLPDWELAFRFSSGRVCLSFCGTVGERWRRSFERLRAPADLGRWLVAAGLADDEPRVTPELLRGAHVLREAIFRLVQAAMAGADGRDTDRAAVNDFARRRPVAAQIGTAGTRQLWTGRDAASAGLAAVAVDAVDLLTSRAIGRVRECDAPDCALLFLDTSRPGRRRWCADGACGSKARSAAYRARQLPPTA
jgi:predicted RNA-binding Zn ribbon-like protein